MFDGLTAAQSDINHNKQTKNKSTNPTKKFGTFDSVIFHKVDAIIITSIINRTKPIAIIIHVICGTYLF